MMSFNQRRLDAICDRLHNSHNPAERRSLFLGETYDHGYPVLLDTDLLLEHMHILGPTGTGKTSLGLETIIIQLIRLGNGPVVVFDCKGDPGLFHTVRLEAQRARRKFKWFTNKPYRSTYIFNPWQQDLLHQLALPETLGLFLQAMNLHHGDDYGRAWFSCIARTLLTRAIEATLPDLPSRHHRQRNQQSRLFPKYGPIRSFRDLHRILHQLRGESDEFAAAQHLAFLAESLSHLDQLNYAANLHPDHPALAHQIRMPEVIRQNQVIYFYLPAAMDVATVAEIARLGMYSLLVAAIAYHDEYGTSPRVYAICDEAQLMISRNFEHVLTQARSHGLACILAHQTISQLNPPGGVDLRELLMSCTAIKQVFAARDPWLQDYISKTSGATNYFNLSYEDPVVLHTAPASHEELYHDLYFREYVGPRLTTQDILNTSSDFKSSLLWIARSSGLTAFRGWFRMVTDWPISHQEHLRRRSCDWPQTTEQTLESVSDWPSDEDYTIPSQTQPALPTPEASNEAAAKLDLLWEKLQHK